MSTLEKIAYFQDRRDEVPNQLLATELAGTKDTAGIDEIAVNLKNPNKNIRSDCIKVLYEIGYLDPSLIASYVDRFLELIKSKDNRMVWGSIIGLATIVSQRPKEIWKSIAEVIQVVENGSVITKVWGMRVLARVAAADPLYKSKIFPTLLNQIRACLPRDVPDHTESILCCVDPENKSELLAVIESRRDEMTSSQLLRFKKIKKLVELV